MSLDAANIRQLIKLELNTFIQALADQAIITQLKANSLIAVVNST